MAIDTAAKRANSARLTVRFLFIGLPPVSGISTDDRENGSAAYIGFSYSTPTAVVSKVARSKLHMSVGIGF